MLNFTIKLAMDTDKIKIFGARVRVDATGKLAELERAERVCFY
jgi:T-complex protein 1 subunit beta